MKVKVRHALLNYQVAEHTLHAFRGQVVDIPDEQAERLRSSHAWVDPGMDLDRPGSLIELPESPSDEELVSWVLWASPAETQELADRRPELVPRLEGAARRVSDERGLQDQHLRGTLDVLHNLPPESGPAVSAALTSDDSIRFGSPPPPGPAGAAEPSGPQPGASVPPPAVPPASDSLLEIVKGTVDDVSRYLADHPEQAQDVLNAEFTDKGGQPRQGVVTAAQTAAQHLAGGQS